MDYFNDVLTTSLGLELSSCVVVYGGQKTLRFHQNIFICVEDERRSLLFLKYWLWGANLSLLLKSYICSLFFHSSCCCKYYIAVQTNVRYTGFHCQPCAVHFSSQGCDSAGGPIATVAEWLQCCGLMRASEELQVVCFSRCHCHQFLPACTGYLKWILNAPLPYRANYFNFFIHKQSRFITGFCLLFIP